MDRLGILFRLFNFVKKIDPLFGHTHTSRLNVKNPDVDELVKVRHSGRSRIESGRSPDGIQLLEKTGFRLLPE
jgi:hypothetical protein